jgi:hypothetical protein
MSYAHRPPELVHSQRALRRVGNPARAGVTVMWTCRAGARFAGWLILVKLHRSCQLYCLGVPSERIGMPTAESTLCPLRLDTEDSFAMSESTSWRWCSS